MDILLQNKRIVCQGTWILFEYKYQQTINLNKKLWNSWTSKNKAKGFDHLGIDVWSTRNYDTSCSQYKNVSPVTMGKRDRLG